MDGQSVSQSVCLGVKPTLGLATRYYFLSEHSCLKFAVLFLWSALSDERTGLQFAYHKINEKLFIREFWKLSLVIYRQFRLLSSDCGGV
jgi:hypothetical protein